MIQVHRGCEVGIFQVYFCQPISGLQVILEDVYPLHFEMVGIDKKKVQFFEVDDRSLPTSFLLHQK